MYASRVSCSQWNGKKRGILIAKRPNYSMLGHVGIYRENVAPASKSNAVGKMSCMHTEQVTSDKGQRN
jgi:hypothetical protein